MRGQKGPKSTPPWWAVVISLSKEYGIPPWEFEEQCNAEWWHRIVEYRKEEAKSLDGKSKRPIRKSNIKR